MKWADSGVDGWSYDDVLPTFRRMENTPTGHDVYHGRSGPLSVRQRSDEDLTPSLLGFVEASVAHGFKRVTDFNGAEQNGTGGYPVNVVDGVRQSTAIAYLPSPVRNRPNLAIVDEVNVDRVLLDNHRAVGVVATDGTTYRAEQGFPHPPVHDPCAVARVIDPAVLTTRRAPVTVELAGSHTRGMTVADLRAPAPPDCRTQVAVDLDHARFWNLVVDALERIGEP